MPKKTLKPTQIVTVGLIALMLLSCFFSVEHAANGQNVIFAVQPSGSAAEIAALEASIGANGGWNYNLQTIYDGIALGETTVAELQAAVDSLSITSTAAAETVFYWYHELGKFGVGINATTIEAALNETNMLPGVGGLPDDYSDGGKPAFILYNRYDLYAYQWASQLGYDASKWNLPKAYDVFNSDVISYGKPILYVEANNGSAIDYGPRYYDECAETFDMYLTFWLLGIPDALSQAEGWWNWTNSNLWNTSGYPGGSFYEYAQDWVLIECEAGGMDQLIWKLCYYDPTVQNVNNIFTDMETRLLSQGWSSPGWRNYTSVHATFLSGSFENAQERLWNTINYWSAMLGFYGNMTADMQSQVDGLLDGSAGPAPAWSLLLRSELYNNATGMFKTISNMIPDSGDAEATADAAVLISLLSTVPVSGALAVPMDDCSYQDINNIIDAGVSSINVTSYTVRVSVAKPGTFLSTFGTNIFEYNLESAGVWQLTFSSDWNSITAKTLVSPLQPKIYLGETLTDAVAIYASRVNGAAIDPVGLVEVNVGGSQTFTYQADSGYQVSQVLVDGSPVPITGSYTFTNLLENHNISVSTAPDATSHPTPPLTPTAAPTTPSPSSSPTPVAPPTQSSSPLIQNATSTPTTSPTPKTHGSSATIQLPLFLGALISFGVILAASLFLTSHLRKHRNLSLDDSQKTSA